MSFGTCFHIFFVPPSFNGQLYLYQWELGFHQVHNNQQLCRYQRFSSFRSFDFPPKLEHGHLFFTLKFDCNAKFRFLQLWEAKVKGKNCEHRKELAGSSQKEILSSFCRTSSGNVEAGGKEGNFERSKKEIWQLPLIIHWKPVSKYFFPHIFFSLMFLQQNVS